MVEAADDELVLFSSVFVATVEAVSVAFSVEMAEAEAAVVLVAAAEDEVTATVVVTALQRSQEQNKKKLVCVFGNYLESGIQIHHE